LRTKALLASAAVVVGANCSAPAVSGGRHAEEIAAMIVQIEKGNSAPCLEILRGVGMTSSDIVGPASAICSRSFYDVTEIVQRDEAKLSFVTVRFQPGSEMKFVFRNGRLETVTTGYSFPKPS
jgi:hypothetical protein